MNSQPLQKRGFQCGLLQIVRHWAMLTMRRAGSAATCVGLVWLAIAANAQPALLGSVTSAIEAFNADAHFDRYHWTFEKVQLARLINARTRLDALPKPLRLTVIGHVGQFCDWPNKPPATPKPEDFEALRCELTPVFAQAMSEAHAKRIAAFIKHGVVGVELDILAAGASQPLVAMPPNRPRSITELREWNARAMRNNRVEIQPSP